MKIEAYTIGRYYLVPVVRGNWLGREGDWPVLGPLHDDTEYIGFDIKHFHVDARFLSDKIWQATDDKIKFIHSVFNRPLHAGLGDGEDSTLEPLGLRRLLCRRAWPRYPREKAKWLPALPAAYADHSIFPAMVCPHRGASLNGLRVSGGCVTCPLHGLRWNVETGKVVHPKVVS